MAPSGSWAYGSSQGRSLLVVIRSPRTFSDLFQRRRDPGQGRHNVALDQFVRPPAASASSAIPSKSSAATLISRPTTQPANPQPPRARSAINPITCARPR